MNQHDIASTTTSRHSINGHTKTFIVLTRHIKAYSIRKTYQGTLEHWIGTLEDTSHILSLISILILWHSGTIIMTLLLLVYVKQ